MQAEKHQEKCFVSFAGTDNTAIHSNTHPVPHSHSFYLFIPAGILLSVLCLFSIGMSGWSISVHAKEKRADKDRPFIVVLDPGHGGNQSGAEENGMIEKDLNLTIAKHLKESLEKDYENVEVTFTRDGDYSVDLKERVQIAADRDAHLLISLHNNARGDNFEYKDGCTVLTAQGNYRPDLAKTEQELACCILSELESLGLKNRGILLRDSESGDTYEDGSIADYYAIIRSGINLEVPSVIVEHAFLDDDQDFENHLSTDDQLKELAQADARGIAAYLGLRSVKTGKIMQPPSNYEIPVYHVYDDIPEHTRKSKKLFFPNEDEKESDTGDEIEDETKAETGDETDAETKVETGNGADEKTKAETGDGTDAETKVETDDEIKIDAGDRTENKKSDEKNSSDDSLQEVIRQFIQKLIDTLNHELPGAVQKE